MEFLLEPWSWFITGLGISITTLLITLNGKSFGVSANLRTLCTLAGAGKKISFFNFEWKVQKWNLLFLLGTMTGGFIASQYLNSGTTPNINVQTINDLKALGFTQPNGILPVELFSVNSGSSIMLLLIGGLLVGFGSRYAGGCTSGHAISGLANLQLPSLIAVIGFFTGGLAMTFIIFPLIFGV
jgi:uncharacterized membrane protein YedE/YeeE